jgi:hypothetical protein
MRSGVEAPQGALPGSVSGHLQVRVRSALVSSVDRRWPREAHEYLGKLARRHGPALRTRGHLARRLRDCPPDARTLGIARAVLDEILEDARVARAAACGHHRDLDLR